MGIVAPIYNMLNLLWNSVSCFWGITSIVISQKALFQGREHILYLSSKWLLSVYIFYRTGPLIFLSFFFWLLNAFEGISTITIKQSSNCFFKMDAENSINSETQDVDKNFMVSIKNIIFLVFLGHCIGFVVKGKEFCFIIWS